MRAYKYVMEAESGEGATFNAHHIRGGWTCSFPRKANACMHRDVNLNNIR